MKLIPKNWVSFQHYKDRCPPWIKLHKGLLDDSNFQRLPTASRALAPMLWLLASESKDGSFDGSIEELAFRLRQSEKEVVAGLEPLILKGFFSELQDDSEVLAECGQLAVPETEGETEGEKSRSADKSAEFPPGFAKFWEAWPTNDRKQAKGKCLDAWKKAKAEPDAAFVIDHVLSLKSSAWLKDGGQFVPAPLVYLNQRRWEGTEASQQSSGVLAGAI